MRSLRTLLSFGLVLAAWTGSCLCHPQSSSGMAHYLTLSDENTDSKEHGQGDNYGKTTCPCGWTNKARIVGGKETLKNEYPLMAGIMKKGEREIFCGGSLLTTRHVLTAAHCPHEYPNDTLTVALGEHDQNQDIKSSGAVFVDVERSILHEQYSPETFWYDIALLFLAEHVQFTQLIGPACMPTQQMNLVNQQLKVMGWGRIKTLGPTSKVLLKTNLRVIPLERCIEQYLRPIKKDQPHQICTFLKKQDSCQGDSGGPVLWLDPATNRYTLVAVVSYGKKCGLRTPALNTDVAYFSAWIQSKIAETDGSVTTCSKA